MATSAASPFDALFAKYAGAIPRDYLRALAYRESAFRPDIVHPTSRATGLFQITSTALASFNQRNHTGLVLANLTDPELNTRVAAQHLAGVINVYRRYRSTQPDWKSSRWVELLTLGWNAGHNAIATIVGKMEASGIPPDRITVDSVSQVAAGLGTGKYVADPARVAWSKSVAALYLGGGPAAPKGLYASMVPGTRGGGGGALFVVALLIAGAIALVAKKGEGR